MSAVSDMDRAIACLALELPGSVYEDVVTKWTAARHAAASMLALADDMREGLIDHADAYYAVENFTRWNTAYEPKSSGHIGRTEEP